MIFADKLIALRKKAGWSQEELAQQLNVSRQSVSKWEGTQSVPDLDKIVQLSRIFGVSTDYLLKDELEAQETAEPEPDQPVRRRVSLEEASRYLELRKQAAPWLALATFLCVLSPITLILLAGLSEYTARISENVAGGIGLCVLILHGRRRGRHLPDVRRKDEAVRVSGDRAVRNGIRRERHGPAAPAGI